jgi:GrpB-like predicted nucleotidyltransferase (UPF0157 family)
MTEPNPEDAIFIGGAEPGVIFIAEWDPAWPQRFIEERASIAGALGDAARMIEHIGSTSVPGLAAKPVIDILIAVDEVDDEDSYRPQLEAAGYVLRVRESGHRMFRTPRKDVHAHIWSERTEIERHIAFRDWLRAHAEDRKLYEDVKRELAKREWSDTSAYAEAKAEVIAEIAKRAR